MSEQAKGAGAISREDACSELRAAIWQVERWIASAKQETAKARLFKRREALVMAIDALLDAEARGRAAELADVVAWMRSPERIWPEQLDRAADAIEDGCHVGAACQGTRTLP